MDDKDERIDRLEAALRSIASMGGTLPDDRLTSPTGVHDAVGRGLMYTYARQTALAALGLTDVGALWTDREKGRP